MTYIVDNTAQIDQLRRDIAAKDAYGVKSVRASNELARLEDEQRSPLVRLARRIIGIILLAVGVAIAYIPIVLPIVNMFARG